MALSPIQALTVRYLAGGWSVAKVAVELKLKPGLIIKWKNTSPEFGEALRRAVANHEELIQAMLLDGEAKAAETLVSALDAVDAKGNPRWSTRVDAALSLLDRAGGRGRAVEKQAVLSASVSSKSAEEVERSLRSALRDPGVRAWLAESGALKALGAGGSEDALRGDVAQPPVPEAEVVEAEIIPITTHEVA